MSRVFTIDGSIETPSNYDEDDVSDLFTELMEEKGFLFSGRIEFLESIPEPEDETEDEEE